jgi:hypothetical protein
VIKNVAFMGIDSPTVSGILLVTEEKKKMTKHLDGSKYRPRCSNRHTINKKM